MFSTKYEAPRLNAFLLIYAFLSIACVIVDYFKLTEYYMVRENNIFHLELAVAKQIYLVLTIFALASLVVTLVSLVLKKYKELLAFIYFPRIEKIDWVIIIFLMLITFLRLPIPDRSFDVVNYHLFLQEFEFENNISYNFFPGNIQTFLFPLGDRLFFIFRLLLGYRGGVLLSTLVLIVLFFQLKELIKLNENTKIIFEKNGILLSFSALFVLSTEYILATVGIYMIDSLALPFLLALFTIAIGRKTNPSVALVFSSLMVGLSISIKLTSVLFCGLLFGAIIFRYYREISVKVIIISSLVIIFPLACYTTYNYTQTDNPIYPFLNKYFGSPFITLGGLSVISQLDYGPKSTFETLIWPLFIFFQPERTNQIPYYSGRLGIGFLVAIAYTGIGLLRKRKDLLFLGLLVLGLINIWSLLSGVIRFGLFLELLSGILIIDCISGLFLVDMRMLKSKRKVSGFNSTRVGNRRKRLRISPSLIDTIYGTVDLTSFCIRGLLILSIMAAMAQGIYAYYLSTITNITDWSQRPSAFNNWQTYTQNIDLIGKDYLPMKYADNESLRRILDEIDVWIVLPPDNLSGYDTLLKSNVPIMNLQMSTATQETLDSFLSLEKSLNLRSKDIYMLSIRPLDVVANELDQYRFKIVAVHEIQPTFTYLPLKLLKITPSN